MTNVPICVGKPIIQILAKEGCWKSENGSGLIAADELFHNDPYAEIERLRAALNPFAEIARWAERNGHDLKDFDMLLRGTGKEIAGHLQVQSDDFIRARAALGDEQNASGALGQDVQELRMWHKDFAPEVREMWDVIAKALMLRAGGDVTISAAELRDAAGTQAEISLRDGEIIFRAERH